MKTYRIYQEYFFEADSEKEALEMFNEMSTEATGDPDGFGSFYTEELTGDDLKQHHDPSEESK